MTQQILNIGAAPGDHTGDTLRTGGQKINANFAELYTTLTSSTLPSTTGNAGKALYTDGSLLYWGTVTATNGVVTTGSYVNPAWITSLSASKITGQVPSAQSLVNGIYTVSLNADGTLTFPNNTVQSTAYLGTATTSIIGGVKPDGTTITINNGVISAASAYTLPTATTSTLGGVKVDGTSITINNGVISGANTYSLPVATTSVLGGVKVDGTSITINGSGVISAGVTGSVVFKGAWNASTNTPTLASGSGTTGWQYTVSVTGTRDLGNGSKTYTVGDYVIYDGTNWISIVSNSGVTTFNARAGAVTLTSNDVTTALGFTPLQTSSISVSTTTASGGGSLTYNAGSFTFAPASVPTYTVNTLSASGSGSLSISGTVLTFTPAAAYSLPTATTSVLGGVKIDNNTIVISNGVISVGGALTSATIFKGSWDATTNTPTLGAGTGVTGYEYIVSVAGTRDIGSGSLAYAIGDLVIYDGAKWVRIPGGNNVTAFNTRQGAITLTSSDVTTALGFTPTQASSLSVTSNTATGTTSTLSYTSGVFTFTSASSSSILNSLAVSSSNGFSGSVSSATLTIQTSINGLLKGNGTAISAATAGTDYQAAISATGLLKSNGTSGNVSAATAGTDYFAPTSTTANYVLAAPNGSAGTPTFRALVASDIPTTHNSITVSGGSLTFSGNISATAWTTSGIRHVSVAATLTDTSSTGTVANAYTNNFGGNTIAASNAVTYTNYGTVFINDPTAGTNVTITNAYSLITAGNVKLGSTGTGTIAAVAATATTASTAASVGYLGMPQQSKSSAYTTVIGDAGKHIYVTATATITIDSNANVAYPIGTTIAFIAASGATVTIAITSDTMYLGGTGTTGSRTLAAYGMATAVKVTATSWFINGTGLT